MVPLEITLDSYMTDDSEEKLDPLVQLDRDLDLFERHFWFRFQQALSGPDW